MQINYYLFWFFPPFFEKKIWCCLTLKLCTKTSTDCASSLLHCFIIVIMLGKRVQNSIIRRYFSHIQIGQMNIEYNADGWTLLDASSVIAITICYFMLIHQQNHIMRIKNIWSSLNNYSLIIEL